MSESSRRSTRGSAQADGWRVWLRDDQAVKEQVLAGQETEPVLTAYGDNDLVLSFLFRSGFWSVLTGLAADGLHQHNGYDPVILNGVEVVRELAGIERIQQCGKVIHDTRLMMQTGFTQPGGSRYRRTVGDA